jgi:hypothetical protein
LQGHNTAQTDLSMYRKVYICNVNCVGSHLALVQLLHCSPKELLLKLVVLKTFALHLSSINIS